MKQEYAKLILSRKSKNLCTNIEKCKQRLKKYDKQFSLVVTMGGLYFICVSVLWISDRKSKILGVQIVGQYLYLRIREMGINSHPNPWYTITVLDPFSTVPYCTVYSTIEGS